ncbi:MAG: aspartate-semialdehyde dehydrogenase [Clostridiales bacterium]|nr:aspartate-semialdehyde dehydrogenase [Clostridiales bacterium]MDD6872578.1 aspartate-semialdehyde dehydrogenase [Clostridiales bacterium]MDD7367239.1 aspartate-semialdehyde dehydrogenase [Clostridiales bacterium]MDY2871624.1 aspartate-semialdehyde dehydrogenase [Eubacteriales bacterium]
MQKYRVGIIGATGMVGQRFLTLLENHPWFEVTALAASARSAGQTYREAVANRWAFDWPIPDYAAGMTILDAADVNALAEKVDFTFCAVDMPKDQIRALEDSVARTETPVVSNNSAHRWTKDVPMMVPEVNSDHTAVIEYQRRRLGTKTGFVAVKPNCSIQGYVPALSPLRDFGIKQISVCTYQAISGAGKTFKRWPEMIDNVIPYIGGEEEKSEMEPLKIWGHVENGEIVSAGAPVISAQCYRVPVSDGHMAAVSVSFDKKPPRDEILDRWKAFKGAPQELNLPSAPKQFLTYFEEDNRPQTRLDRDLERGMGVSLGRLREDSIFDYKFAALAHNTVRGAAGGAVLTAELLCAQGYIPHK